MIRTLLLLLAFFAATPALADPPSRFSVVVTGRGPDVILIPGLTAGRDSWAATAAAVPGYRYHLIQVAGFAGEPARGNARGAVVAPVAEEIARYIAANRLDHPAVIGHSMGGTVTLLIAARHPDLIGKAMVVDMLPQPAGLFGSSAASMGPLAQSLAGFIGTPSGRELFAQFMGAFTPPTASNRRSDPDVVGRAAQELATMDLTSDLPRIRAPITVVYAAPDAAARAGADAAYRRAYANARGARLIRIDDSGHMVMLDQPARFRAAMRDFLAR